MKTFLLGFFILQQTMMMLFAMLFIFETMGGYYPLISGLVYVFTMITLDSYLRVKDDEV